MTPSTSNSTLVTRQSRHAVCVHSRALAGNEFTCIDCHKGIAHRLPEIEGIEMLYGAPIDKISEQAQ